VPPSTLHLSRFSAVIDRVNAAVPWLPAPLPGYACIGVQSPDTGKMRTCTLHKTVVPCVPSSVIHHQESDQSLCLSSQSSALSGYPGR